MKEIRYNYIFALAIREKAGEQVLELHLFSRKSVEIPLNQIEWQTIHEDDDEMSMDDERLVIEKKHSDDNDSHYVISGIYKYLEDFAEKIGLTLFDKRKKDDESE